MKKETLDKFYKDLAKAMNQIVELHLNEKDTGKIEDRIHVLPIVHEECCEDEKPF